MIFRSSGMGRALYAGQKTRHMALPFFYFFLILLFLPLKTHSQTPSPLPLIPNLDSRDLIFRQYIADVEAARRHIFSSRRNIEETGGLLTIYSYLVREEDDLIRIAARCNIPLASLVSLNRLSNGEDLMPGMTLLLPSMPGIFVPENPASELENLMSSTRADDINGIVVSIPREGSSEWFVFIPGDDFTSTERIFFFNRGFQFPLRDFRVTSLYGPRVNPVTGRTGHHRGIDLAAPEGTEVFSVRSGTVIDTGFNSILGNYIMIAHDNNWVSVYGHLSSINVILNSRYPGGSFIGRVGSTGMSTGPHLHFELINNGQNHDPARLLGIFAGQ